MAKTTDVPSAGGDVPQAEAEIGVAKGSIRAVEPTKKGHRGQAVSGRLAGTISFHPLCRALKDFSVFVPVQHYPSVNLA